jgi:hypothetical protein
MTRRRPLPTGADADVVSGLRLVADAFVQLQDRRHTADYDNGKIWGLAEATEDVVSALSAFEVWNQIKHTNIAQEYLVSLLIRPRD